MTEPGQTPQLDELDILWSHHHAQWRDPMQVLSMWNEGGTIDRNLLRFQAQGDWWGIVEKTQSTLVVSREYEHLLIGMTVVDGEPHITWMELPHPSGMVYDKKRGILHIASTRNPNQVLDFKPITNVMSRLDLPYTDEITGKPLTLIQSRFYPGCLYMHDLALIGDELHANSVGQNAIVRLGAEGSHERVWYPKAIMQDGEPVFGQNHLQLNSIAAGGTLADSYFSASTDTISARRPGHKNFPVDGKGVIFSGKTREVIAQGLTRPHSARLHHGKIWVDNSGYGEFGTIENGGFTPIVKLNGWTRGLGLHDKIAFVGTSRVIPRFRQYAPGLDVDSSVCGIHAVDLETGAVLGSIIWQYGNQIFSIEVLPLSFTTGFVFSAQQKRATDREKRLFYAFQTD